MNDDDTPATPTASRKISVVVGGSSPSLRGASPSSPVTPTTTTPSTNKRKRKITIKLPAFPLSSSSSSSSAVATSSFSSPGTSSSSSFISLSSSLPSSSSATSSLSAGDVALRRSAQSSPSSWTETTTTTTSSTPSMSPTVSAFLTSSPSLPSFPASPTLGTTSSKRVKGALVERPIIYGSISWWLGKKAEETRTHRWTTYVRGPHNEDLSYFIKKVVFTLHPSFPNPVRVVEKPPFEITEHGWGEFELGIRIHFVDPLEVPVDLVHGLVLYPPEGSIGLSTKKPVIKEIYDEIEFHDPTEQFYKILKDNEMSEKERKDLDELAKARSKVREEIIKIHDAYERYDAQSRQLREEVKELTELAEAEYKKRQKVSHQAKKS